MGNTSSAGTQTKPRLLDQVRDKIRFKHDSIRTPRGQVFPFAGHEDQGHRLG